MTIQSGGILQRSPSGDFLHVVICDYEQPHRHEQELINGVDRFLQLVSDTATWSVRLGGGQNREGNARLIMRSDDRLIELPFPGSNRAERCVDG